MALRDEVKLLLARQLAVQNGQVWDRLTPAARARQLTFAGNLLATVERLAQVNWSVHKEAP